MPSRTLNISVFTVPTFAFWIGAAVLLGAVTARLHTGNRLRAGVFADVLLVTLFGAVIGARAEHILLQWNYFSMHTEEIVRLGWGGLSWHGAVWGGIVVFSVVVRVRNIPALPVLDGLTPSIPLLGLAGWYGCWAAACGSGLEVDTLAHYPALVVFESQDVYGIIAPRFNTPLLGLILAAVVLVIALVLIRRGMLPVRRFGLTLIMFSMGMLMLGFLRGDAVPYWGSLRADQWLDGAMALTGVLLTVFTRPVYFEKDTELA